MDDTVVYMVNKGYDILYDNRNKSFIAIDLKQIP